MRFTSYRNLLWITALLAASGIAAPAQHFASGANPPPPIQQLSNANTGGTAGQASADSAAQPATSASAAKNPVSGQAGVPVEKASVVPDSASLLPVAALVGFSFLLGGIVCGTIKKRP